MRLDGQTAPPPTPPINVSALAEIPMGFHSPASLETLLLESWGRQPTVGIHQKPTCTPPADPNSRPMHLRMLALASPISSQLSSAPALPRASPRQLLTLNWFGIITHTCMRSLEMQISWPLLHMRWSLGIIPFGSIQLILTSSGTCEPWPPWESQLPCSVLQKCSMTSFLCSSTHTS